MNDILAGDPAPTNPTAREQLDFLLHAAWQPTRKIESLLDAYRAEVLAQAADRMAHLLQDTPEYGPWVASKLRAMAAEGGESRG